MLWKNSHDRFGFIAILLHWLMALIIIGLIILGLYMTSLPLSVQQLKYYGWHKEYGLLILGLVVFRLFWRLTNPEPKLLLPCLEKRAAHLTHWALYGFMIFLPLTGWLMSSAAGFPISFFGLCTLPNLIDPNEHLRALFTLLHKWSGYGLMVTICLHALAALKHHFIDKDTILRRMISWH